MSTHEATPAAGATAPAPLPPPAAPAAPAAPGRSGPAVLPSWSVVRVHGPRGAVDVALPAASSVAEVVDELTGRLLPGAPLGRPGDAWYLHRLGSPPFAPERPLGDAGLRDGDALHLTPRPMPRPAQRLDDGLVALAEGAARAGRWTPHAVGVLAVAGLVAAALLTAGLGLALPGGPAIAVVLTAVLLVLAGALRGPDDLPALGAGLAALPTAAIAGAGIGATLGPSPAQPVLGAGIGVLGSALVALAVLPRRVAWWAFAGAVGVSVAVGAAVAGLGLLTPAGIAAVLATVWLAALLAVPWFTVRRRTWTEPEDVDTDELLDRARATRRTLDAVGLAGAVVIAVAGIVVVDAGGGIALGFVAAVSCALALRARRSVFVVESGAALGAAAVGLGVVALALSGQSGLPIRTALAAVAALVGVGPVALSRSARRAAAGDATSLSWWSRPKTRRLLTVLEGVAAVAVLPLLLGVLGVYEVAADAGAGL